MLPTRRMWFPLAMLAGAALMGLGLLQMRAASEPADVVNQFLEALRGGNREEAIALLTEPQLTRANHHPEKRWRASPRMQFRIEDTTVDGTTATVIVEILDAGTHFRPRFMLVSQGEDWLISEIVQAKLDERREADQLDRIVHKLEAAAQEVDAERASATK